MSPLPPLRKWGIFLVALAASLLATPVLAKLPKLVLAGPYAAVSNPLIHMVESGALRDVAEQVEFVAWKDPDQLRVLALNGKADFIAMPTNVAANLYNRGVKLNLLNVSTWGVLWMVSRDPNLKTLADFRGKEIAMPFRADMPDIVFGLLAEGQGLDPKRDFKPRYVASPLDAMQLLVMRRVDHALLAEPAVSMALRKTRSFPLSVIAPDLYRSVDLQKEWGRVYHAPARLPQAGIAVLGKAREDAALVARFQAAYAASLKWCQAHAVACGEMVAKRVDMLTPEAVTDSIAVSQMRFATVAEARPELESFFARLLAKQPAVLGGKMPDAGFYLAAPAKEGAVDKGRRP
jgi:NitT/TauT family transport system substrate-binding protein